MAGYPCCRHCDHDEPDYDPAGWQHDEPCPSGCDDGPDDGDYLEAADIAAARLDPMPFGPVSP